MSKVIELKRGHDIKLVGEAGAFYDQKPEPATYALKPVEFNMRVKLLVKEGDEVKAGTPLFYSKNNENAIFTSPVSGEVVEINRGAKRIVTEVKILADKVIKYEELGAADPLSLPREEVIEKLKKSGCWPFIRKRPFNKIPNPQDTPKSIFVSAFDSAPLAPNMDFIMEGQEDVFQTGINALTRLTEGRVHLNLRKGETTARAFINAENVQKNYFSGPHPSGNVGVQIHHIDPVGKREEVWYCSPQDVLIIGKLFKEGRFDPERTVVLTGQSVKIRKYHKLRLGANVENLFVDNVEEGHLRYISGNVLTGQIIRRDGFLSFYDNHITVIPEGDEPEFQGWLMPSYPRPSISPSFPWTYDSTRRFRVNTNTHGEERPYVVTEEYEKVLPMDIYPVYLIKAILAQDLDKMEGLGIYEVGPEDLALCEFVCTSKTPVQEIIREGLELMEKEG